MAFITANSCTVSLCMGTTGQHRQGQEEFHHDHKGGHAQAAGNT